MSTKLEIRIEASPAHIAAAAARYLAALTRQASPAHLFNVALSGGSTPKLLYDLLTSDPFRDEIPWHSIRFFFGDERWVPHTDPASNFKLANDYLFQPLNINRTLIYPMPTSGDPQDAATHYEATLRGAFNLQEGDVPTFDLVFQVGLSPQKDLGFFIGYNWTANYAGTINDQPGTHIDSFGILDASLTYKLRGWNVAAFGNNLTNEGAFTHTYAVGPTPQGGSLWKFANPRVPRTYGVKVTYRF